MSIVGDIVGGLTSGAAGATPTGAITAVSGLAQSIVERIWPDPTEQAKAKMALAQMTESGELQRLTIESGLLQGQIAINLEEAKSESLWKSGGRPFIMWTCGGTFFLQYMLFPLLNFALGAFGHPQVSVAWDADTVMTVMLGLLGITFGGLRTAEKIKSAS